MENDNIVDLKQYKKEREQKRKEKEQSRKVPALMAFEPNQYYINPDQGVMIHVLFITDKSDVFHNKMMYVVEDPVGQFWCAPVEEETCRGWHELHPDVFRRELEKHRCFMQDLCCKVSRLSFAISIQI